MVWASSLDLNNCTSNSTYMDAINKFADYTRDQMQIAYEKSPSIRSVWAPSCPFHCLPRYGEIDEAHAKNYTVPMNTENSVGEAVHWWLYQNYTGSFLDKVSWPDNVPCSNKKAQLCKMFTD